MKGSKHHTAKLNEAQVVEIRQRMAEGEAMRAVAAVFGVTPETISHIKRGLTWRHVSFGRARVIAP